MPACLAGILAGMPMHLEAIATPGAAASESVVWAKPFAVAPIVVVTAVSGGSAPVTAQVTERTTTGATVISWFPDTAIPVARVKMVLAAEA